MIGLVDDLTKDSTSVSDSARVGCSKMCFVVCQTSLGARFLVEKKLNLQCIG